MKIKHFLLNAFIIENKKVKIAIDPGRNLLSYKLNSLIPKSEWMDVTHILVTHGDRDHCDFTVRMAKASKAPVICGNPLEKKLNSNNVENIKGIGVGDVIDLGDFQVEGIKTEHGALSIELPFGLLKYEYKPIKAGSSPSSGKGFGLGAIGLKIILEKKVIINLGDTILLKEWEGLKPDLLMIPIGGRVVKTCMDEENALEAVKYMKPKKVIPCHYYNDVFRIRNVLHPADIKMFKREVEEMGIECMVMNSGDEMILC